MQSQKDRRQIGVFFVDPMSYHNLAVYDCELLSNIDNNIDICYYANDRFNLSMPDTDIKKIYRYSQKKGLFKIISYLKSQIILLRDIKEKRPDIVHFQWLKYPPVDYWFLVYIKRYSGIVYTSHDVFTHGDERKYRASLIKILKIVDQVIVHTTAGKQELATFVDQGRIEVIRHGLLDLARFFQTEPEQLKEKLKIGNEVVFSALGTMDYYKGTDLLVEAWQSSPVLRQSPKVKLIIAGKNKMRLKKAAIPAANVIFIDGDLSDEEFSALLQLSDLVLLPYRRISQSGLLLSAIAAEKKLLISTAFPEPSKYGAIGWVLRQVDAAGLRTLLERIHECLAEETAPVDQATWRQIKAEYDWAGSGAQTSRLYRRVAQKQ
jgi:glycosyltransferase involved in cell wall biosynthesis